MVGIDKSKSGNMRIWVTENSIDEVRKIKQIDGATYPEEELPDNEKILAGFEWREEERPRSVEDLFADDPPLELPIIKGLDDYVPEEEFFDQSMIERAKAADKAAKEKAKYLASRNLPKNLMEDKKQEKKTIKPKKDQN